MIYALVWGIVFGGLVVVDAVGVVEVGGFFTFNG